MIQSWDLWDPVSQVLIVIVSPGIISINYIYIYPKAPVPDTEKVFAEGGISLDMSHGAVMSPEGILSS